jgi:hypothetical protein
MPGQVQDTLYQVSTATALVEGSTRAPGKSPLCGRTVIWVQVTFEGLDGEMVVQASMTW